jgi:MoxR-like ATPase
MQEKQVTTQGETFPLKEPFFVMATQNPIESVGKNKNQKENT